MFDLFVFVGAFFFIDSESARRCSYFSPSYYDYLTLT
jgi:hypothetical protein